LYYIRKIFLIYISISSFLIFENISIANLDSKLRCHTGMRCLRLTNVEYGKNCTVLQLSGILHTWFLAKSFIFIHSQWTNWWGAPLGRNTLRLDWATPTKKRRHRHRLNLSDNDCTCAGQHYNIYCSLSVFKYYL